MVGPSLIIAFIIGAYLVNSVKILNEYERGVIFLLGRLVIFLFQEAFCSLKQLLLP